MEGIDEVLARYRAGPHRQSVPWNREIWEVLWAEDPTLPARPVLDAIDAEVHGDGRGTIRRQWIRGLADGDPLLFLAASTIWGYGSYVRFGRPALRAMLTTPAAAATTRDIIEKSRESPQAGFASLFAGGRTRIKQLSVAFGTKAVHFAGYDFSTPKPLILDKRVYTAARRLGIDVVPDPERYTTGNQYEAYCGWAMDVAARNKVEPQDVEYALFAAGGSSASATISLRHRAERGPLTRRR